MFNKAEGKSRSHLRRDEISAAVRASSSQKEHLCGLAAALSRTSH